jgi:hypothetical protein
MLYLRWLEISHRYAAKPAIFDENGRVTFADLAAAVSQRPIAHPSSPAVVVSISWWKFSVLGVTASQSSPSSTMLQSLF